jgi:transposase-like protein
VSNALYTPKTLLEVIRYFSDEQKAFEYIKARRFPDGVACPRCNSAKVAFIETRRLWRCNGCRRQFSVKVGTIFEDSPIKLSVWIPAMWLIANAKNGISSYELHRSLGVTQKTAWFMLHRIRLAMENGTFEKLSGEVEADETYIGGKAANMHYSKRKERGVLDGGFGKTIVLGLVERGGRMVCHVIERRNGRAIKPLVYQNVKKGSTMFTDNHGAYHGLYKDFLHGVVDREQGYVWGPIHTNTCEGFWSLVKRSIRGTYCAIEPIHVHRYMAEYTFRYNERKGNDAIRFETLSGQVSGKRLTYKKLIGKGLVQTA